jgi:adenylate cyclase
MEQDLAILIADLSGYTALTETHGAAAAADLVDKYLDIVEESLCASCRLHERTGDEIMVISEVPDDLLCTALLLLQKSHQEENFLQLHGGLHVGKLLQRKGGYFGAALNFTARIAAKANAGSLWCSLEFKEAIKNSHAAVFEHKGSLTFKNISAEKDVFEIITNHADVLLIDPVCRMLLTKENAIPHPVHDVLFCSPDCLAVFDAQYKSGLSAD